MGFTVSSDKEQGYTKISNQFIQSYMATANGSYIKLYLYLQMLCQHPDTADIQTKNAPAALNNLADKMECTESDIFRALRYWNKQGLLEWNEHNGEICEIKLLEPLADTPSKASVISSTPLPGYNAPEKQSYTPLQAEALRKDIEIDKAIQRVETLLGEPVSPAHLQLILYLMCDIGFSSDLLSTLYETALKKGKKKPSYIEAIGLSWASQGIQTPEEAREESLAFNGRYALVAKELSFTDILTPVSRELIDSWDSYNFSDDIIREACRRAAGRVGGGPKGLTYASKILKRWNEQNVRSTDDILREDESFRRQKKNTAPRTTAVKNKFQNFPQRVYSSREYASLEKRLLQK